MDAANDKGAVKAWSKYESTVARRHRPWTRPASLGSRPIIDMHGHASPARALEFIASRRPPPPKAGTPTLPDAVNAIHDEDTRPLLTEPKRRLERLDRMGIDRQVIWPTPHLHSYYELPLELAVQGCVLTNDGMAEFAAAVPERFVPMGTVPMQDPAAAVAELERCVSRLGIRGIQLLGHIGPLEVSDAKFEPFWKRAEELDALVFIHGSGNDLGGRLNRHNLVNAIGNPLETTIALSMLISDGILERYPRLRILGAHGAGFLGAYFGRSDHNWGARADGYNGLPHPPTFYLRRNVIFDSVVFSPDQLRALVATYGADHVVVGTDYPFNMGEFDPVGHLLALDAVSEEEKAMVLSGTASKLLEH
jgi:aminocarboxymuconate-semialdehyde decarboxylase